MKLLSFLIDHHQNYLQHPSNESLLLFKYFILQDVTRTSCTNANYYLSFAQIIIKWASLGLSPTRAINQAKITKEYDHSMDYNIKYASDRNKQGWISNDKKRTGSSNNNMFANATTSNDSNRVSWNKKTIHTTNNDVFNATMRCLNKPTFQNRKVWLNEGASNKDQYLSN